MTRFALEAREADAQRLGVEVEQLPADLYRVPVSPEAHTAAQAEEPVGYYDRRELLAAQDGGNGAICFGLLCVLLAVCGLVQWVQATFLPVP